MSIEISIMPTPVIINFLIMLIKKVQGNICTMFSPYYRTLEKIRNLSV